MNSVEEIQEWINAVLEAVQEIVESGEEIPDEVAGQIADAISEEEERILQLQNNQNIPQGNAQPAVPADAQLLWILSGQKEQPFISYLNTYQTPETQALLSNPSALASVISQLNRMMPEGQPQVIDGIQEADLNSSNVWGTAYDPRSGKMKVRFQGGSEYEYDGIPAPIYNAVAQGNASARTKGKNQYGEWWPNKNPSLGAALNQYVKAGGFSYRRLK